MGPLLRAGEARTWMQHFFYSQVLLPPPSSTAPLLPFRSRTQPSVMYVLDYVIERKGVGDLASSIKDHR